MKNNLESIDNVNVSRFIKYLTKVIDGDIQFSHSYEINSTRKNWIRFNHGNILWRCGSLEYAFDSYFWEGKTYRDTKVELDEYQTQIRRAVSKGSPEGDKEALKASWNILKWGGVTNHNSAWLVDKCANEMLADSFQLTIDKLEGSKLNNSEAYFVKNDWDTTSSPYRMNAGYTKIYSLLCDDFIIYDSRVAATFGLLVRKFCEHENIEVIPEALKFPYMDAKEGKSAKNKKNRNPNKIEPVIGSFPTKIDNSEHAKWNIQANIILRNAADKSKNILNWEYCGGDGIKKRVSKKERLRALESAFFMIGYNLPVR